MSLSYRGSGAASGALTRIWRCRRAAAGIRVPGVLFLSFLGLSAVAYAGCGGKDEGPTGSIVVARPATPSRSQCGSTAESGGRRAEKPPRPGTYEYRARGRRILIGDRRRAFKLPPTIEIVVSPMRRVGTLACFALQRRYDKGLADTGVFVIRGSDIYVRSARFQDGSYIKSFTPSPPILSLSGSELNWSGEFRGSTAGRYAAEVVGRKTIKVGSRSVRVVGVQTRGSYAGAIKGWERSIRWFALDRNLVVAETSTQRRTLGLDRLRLTYSARLKSLKPR